MAKNRYFKIIYKTPYVNALEETSYLKRESYIYAKNRREARKIVKNMNKTAPNQIILTKFSKRLKKEIGGLK